MHWLIWIAVVAFLVFTIFMTIRKMSNLERDARLRAARSRTSYPNTARNRRGKEEIDEIKEEPAMLKNVANKLKMFGSNDEDHEVYRSRSRQDENRERKPKQAVRREESRRDHSDRRWKIILEDRVMTDIHEFIFLESVGIGRKLSESFDQYLMVNDPRVSGIHCSIYSRNGKLYIRDEGSKNHTYLNGERLEGPELIQKEDIISLGETRLEVLKILRES